MSDQSSNAIGVDSKITKAPKVKVPKDSDKYRVALKLINKILTNIGSSEIDDLTKFVNILREDIIREDNTTTLTDMEKELFQVFDKHRCGYHRKTDAIVLNCIRSMMKDMGFSFVHKAKDKSETINGRYFRRKRVFYSII